MRQKKRITDPIHGSIFLNSIESEIVSSKSFQRLHNIRQLGLAHLIFPGANYSRFSHSIGACHNVSKMLQAARDNSNNGVDHLNTLEKSLRLGALLHDIGHYPFSHATEHVIQNFYSKNKLQLLSQADISQPDLPKGDGINHEMLGRKVLDHDPELLEIFARHNFDAEAVKAIFGKEDPENSLIEMISSDLDCDRLDYLRRTAHHTGLPYGAVDTEFLANQARLDSNSRYCLSSKATRAADHLLISRYYDYLQVPYNKTVCALEWSLITCIETLLEDGLDCSAQSMVDRIKSGEWHLFDDNYFFEQFRKLLNKIDNSSVLHDHLKAILERKPAITLASYESLMLRKNSKAFKSQESTLEKIISDFAKQESIDPARLKVWSTHVSFAKYSIDDAKEDYAIGAIRIIDETTGQSRPLCIVNDSLFGKLIDQDHRGLRVFYLEDPKSKRPELREKLVSYLNQNFDYPMR